MSAEFWPADGALRGLLVLRPGIRGLHPAASAAPRGVCEPVSAGSIFVRVRESNRGGNVPPVLNRFGGAFWRAIPGVLPGSRRCGLARPCHARLTGHRFAAAALLHFHDGGFSQAAKNRPRYGVRGMACASCRPADRARKIRPYGWIRQNG